MPQLYTIGLIGARGYTGRVLLQLIESHPQLTLAFAGSREFAGKPVADMAPEITTNMVFEALTPQDSANRGVDIVVLALPDGTVSSYVEAFETHTPGTILIDLSADYRFSDTWVYGLPELLRLQGKESRFHQATRIANPGCYATAMQLGLAPLKEYLSGVPSVFGVSGYSGAGTKSSDKNDPERLADNLMPYKLTGHNHEREATRHLGFPLRFSPHVHPAFSGLITTIHAPLAKKLSVATLFDLYETAYANEPLVRLQETIPDLKQGTDINGLIIGGFDVATNHGHAVIVAAEDNLRKGAAVQAMQNVNLALGLPELMGIVPV